MQAIKAAHCLLLQTHAASGFRILSSSIPHCAVQAIEAVVQYIKTHPPLVHYVKPPSSMRTRQ